MSAMKPLPKDHPKIIAWEQYQTTEEYRNSKRWVDPHDIYPDSLWMIFNAGYEAGVIAEAATPQTGFQTLRLPLTKTIAASINLPLEMDEKLWKRMLAILEAMKPGILNSDEDLERAGIYFMPERDH